MNTYATLEPLLMSAISRGRNAKSYIDKFYAEHGEQVLSGFARVRAEKDIYSPLLAQGRLEHYTLSLYAWAIWIDANAHTKSALLKSANNKLVSHIERQAGIIKNQDAYAKPQTVAELYHYAFTLAGDDDVAMMDNLAITYGALYLQGLDAETSDEIISMLTGYTDVVKTNATPDRSRDITPAQLKQFYGFSELHGYTPIAANMPAEYRELLEQFELLMSQSGITIDNYCYNISLDRYELAPLYPHDINSPHEQQLSWLMVAISLFIKANRADRSFVAEYDRTNELASLSSIAANAAKTVLKLEAQEGEKQAEIDRLSDLSAELQEKLNRAEAELAQAKADMQELAPLRDALWQLHQAQEGIIEAEEAPEREIPDGIVSIGGHATWASAMQRAVPNAAFLHADVSFQNSQIRNATELWFNLNVLSHGTYYRACNIARQYNIPIRYFGDLSIENSVKMLKRK